MSDAAIFLDKDGTLVENVPHNVEPAGVRLLPGVLDGLRRLQSAGYRLIVVAHQPGVAFARLRRPALARIEERMDRLVAAGGVIITAYAWCPPHPRGAHPWHAASCECRKPEPGLLLDAAREHALDLAQSWMIGSILDDIEAGNRVGCRSVLVDRGGETEWRSGAPRAPHAIVHRFDAAADVVLRAARPVRSPSWRPVLAT